MRSKVFERVRGNTWEISGSDGELKIDRSFPWELPESANRLQWVMFDEPTENSVPWSFGRRKWIFYPDDFSDDFAQKINPCYKHIECHWWTA